ncbi:MAG: hypothetical protein AB8G14_05370 [Ilumatobacter sp.]
MASKSPITFLARAAAITGLLASLVVATSSAPIADAAHPGPNGPVAFAHVDGAIIIAQPNQPDASQWTEIIRPPTGTTAILDEPSISPDGRLVAYRLIGPFDTELWLYDRQSGQSGRIDSGMAGPPSWLPDGRSIVYTATDPSDLIRKVAIADLDAGSSRLLGAVNALETAVAPAGDQILYWDDVQDELGLLDVATGEQRVIFESGTNDIIVGQSLQAIVPGSNPPAPYVNVIQANWAPDSQSFVFNCGFVDARGENNGFLCTMDADGTNARVITGGRFSGTASGGAFSPQGTQILFSAFPGSPARIWVMPASGIDAAETGVAQFTTQNSIGASHQSPDVGVPFGTTATPASEIPNTPLPSTDGGPTSPSAPPAGAADVSSLTPSRLLDTRQTAGASTIDGRFEGDGRAGEMDVIKLDVVGRGGVPRSGVAAVVLNITAVSPAQRGFLSIYPCGSRPNASSLNYEPGANRASEVIAKVSDDGAVCVFTRRASHLIADVTGYVPDGSDLSSITPARLLDTRATGETVDGRSQGGDKVQAGRFVEVQVTGRGGVPSTGVASAVLNVTAVSGERNGFLTVYDCGDVPNASALNYRVASNVANEVVAKLTSSGSVCVFTRSTAHVLVDVTGYLRPTSDLTSLTPARLLESRIGSGLDTIDGKFEGIGTVDARGVVELEVAGRGGVPTGAEAVVLNVTAVGADGRGFFTLYPCAALPLASSLNYEAATSTANEVVAKLSSDGDVCIFTQSRTEIIVDVTGYVS